MHHHAPRPRRAQGKPPKAKGTKQAAAAPKKGVFHWLGAGLDTITRAYGADYQRQRQRMGPPIGVREGWCIGVEAMLAEMERRAGTASVASPVASPARPARARPQAPRASASSVATPATPTATTPATTPATTHAATEALARQARERARRAELVEALVSLGWAKTDVLPWVASFPLSDGADLQADLTRLLAAIGRHKAPDATPRA